MEGLGLEVSCRSKTAPTSGLDDPRRFGHPLAARDRRSVRGITKS